MRLLTGKLVAMSCLLTLGLGAMACTDDPTGDQKLNNNDTKKNPKVEPPANSKLSHVAPTCDPMQVVCSGSATLNSASRRMQVQLVDSAGLAVKNATIKFEIKTSDAEQARLEAANATTNDEGIAESFLKPGGDTGVVRVVASTSDPNIKPIEFLISVNSKDAADYIIDFEQVGNYQAKKIDVFLYKGDTTCASIRQNLALERDDDPTTNAGPDFTAEYSLPPAQVEPDGRYPIVTQANVMNGTAYTVVAYAYLPTNEAVEVAMGCKDNNPAVETGTTVRVTVPLIKNLPNIKGDYRIVQKFDLRDGLPDNVRLVVDLLGTLISDPGAFIVGCEASDNTCAIPTDGLVNILVDFLPDGGALGDLKDAIKSFLDSNFTQSVARNVINDALDDYLQNNPNVPSWVKDGRQITTDIYNTLKEFEVVGTLRIKDNPSYIVEMDGRPVIDGMGRTQAVWNYANEEDKNEHIWNEVSFFWNRGCDANSPPNCGKRSLDPSTLGGATNFVKGYWDGTVWDGNMLRVNEHSLTLNYGALVLAVVEKIVLPAIFGQQVQSIEDLFKELVDCQKVADEVADRTISGAGPVVKNLCDQLLQQASDAIRDYATNKLVADGEDNFLISTPEDNHCTMLGPDAYPQMWDGMPLPLIESMGEAEPLNKQCVWDVDIKFSSNAADARKINGTFYGSRK